MQLQRGHLNVVCGYTAAACLLEGTLKCHRVLGMNMALNSTSAMKLELQKAKEWAGSSHQSHGFNLTHIA